MEDLPELSDLIPPEGSSGIDAARRRLRAAAAAERRRVRREWFFVRSVLVGTMIFAVWSIAPTGQLGDTLPLVGLAEATAQLRSPSLEPGAEWYVREERSEWISLTDLAVGDPTEVTVQVDTVAETWVDVTASTVRQRLVSEIAAMAPDDQAAIELVQRSEGLNIGRFETDDEVRYPAVHPMWGSGPDEVLAELTAAVGSSGDVRLDRLAVLQTVSDLMQQHGSDPAKRSVLLLTIARIPGIEVDVTERAVSVRYEYVVGAVAQEVNFRFDRTNGALVGESITTLATPTSQGFVLSESRFEARPASKELSGS